MEFSIELSGCTDELIALADVLLPILLLQLPLDLHQEKLEVLSRRLLSSSPVDLQARLLRTSRAHEKGQIQTCLLAKQLSHHLPFRFGFLKAVYKVCSGLLGRRMLQDAIDFCKEWVVVGVVDLGGRVEAKHVPFSE